MVDKTLRMALLFDTYGNLLTDKQREFFTLYYSDDLSLGEIAVQFGISRQAVYDILKRSEHALTEFENRLGLVARDEMERLRLDSMLKALAELETVMAFLPPAEKVKACRALAVLRDNLSGA